MVLVLGLGLSCSPSSAPATRFSQDLDAWLSAQFPANAPGIAVLVAGPEGQVLFSKGYGLADLKTRKPITPQTLFNLGSVTKTMVGLGILYLEQEGKLSIEDPLLHYFPGFKNKEAVKDIRIKHLLSHTSGLPDNRPVSKDSIYFLTADDAQNFAPILLNDSLHFAPGSAFEYSNPAFNGLALILEKVSGMNWQDYLKKTLFQQAGMTHSTFTDGPFPDTGVAHGYQYLNNQWSEYDYGEYPTFCASGNGGAWSSTEELWQYEKAIRSFQLVKETYTRLARSVFHPDNWADSLPPFVGYDWFIRPLDGWQTIGHTGDQGGFRADYVHYPDQGYFIVTLSNGSHDLSVVRTAIVDRLRKHFHH